MAVAITDIVIVARRERLPTDYSLVSIDFKKTHQIENSADGRRADFPEGRVVSARRYLCFSRRTPSPRKGRVAVTELKVIPASDNVPLGYEAVNQTHDDNTRTFSSKQLLVKYTPLEQAKDVVSELLVLSAAKKELVPKDYKRLPEINGFSICYKMTPLPKQRPNSTGQATQQPRQTPPPGHPFSPIGQTKQPPLERQTSIMAKNVKSAIDGLKFKLNTDQEVSQHIVKVALPELELLSLDDIDRRYTFDWSLFKNLT